MSENTLWVEKHRPESLDDIVGHDAIVERLSLYVNDAEVPHMLFAGPPGTGKTAVITAFAKEVYGDSWRANLNELNASDERGIDVVRDKIKTIARSNPAGGADYQIIFLDEADALTTDAQKPLRRMMEQYSDVTRFFLSCNYPNKIIEPLQSRCTTFRMGRVGDDAVREVIEKVVSREGIEITDDALTKVVRDCRGDLRSAVMSLQSATVNGEITESSVETVVGVVDDAMLHEVVDNAISGDLEAAMTQLDQDILKQGAAPSVVANGLLRVLKKKDLPAPGRRRIYDKLAECEWRVEQGANPQVQFHSLIADVNVCYHLTHGEYDNE